MTRILKYKRNATLNDVSNLLSKLAFKLKGVRYGFFHTEIRTVILGGFY